METVFRLIESHPGTGSVLHADLVPASPVPLRFHLDIRFHGYLVYQLELPVHILIVRVWNESRTLQTLLESKS
ncbi:hypothetical protein [Stenotrophomonas cyclobalanopsidis]|uniref:hypothetical protein n=1 Tax=Stenotrophomonas cyclobalanopsidis TaxID=2771362 RepID=UPI003460EF20